MAIIRIVNKEYLGGFLFTLFVFLVTLRIWYLIFFENGVQRFAEAVIQNSGEKFSFLTKPYVSKIFITIMLIIVLFALYIATKKLFGY